MSNFPLFQISDTIKLISKAINYRCNDIRPEYQKDGLKIGEQFTMIDSFVGENVNGVEQYISFTNNKGEVFDCYPSWCFELVQSSNSNKYEEPICLN